MSFDNEKFEVSCPNPKCSEDIELSYRDAMSRKAKCRRCGTEITIDSSAANDLQRSARDFEKATTNLVKSQTGLFKNAQLKLK